MNMDERSMPGDVTPEEIQESNAIISIVFSDMFKPMIGPLRSNKLITSETDGFGVVSNNAYPIIRELRCDHPVADLIIDAGITQGEEVGDGVSTVMILIGELVRRGYKLISEGIHQSIIVEGYKKALKKTEEILDEISEDVSHGTALRDVAFSALENQGEMEKKLADVIVDSVRKIENEKPVIENVKIIAETGKSTCEFELFDGIVVEGEAIDEPRRIEDAKIALLDHPVEHREPKLKVRKGGKEQEFIVSICSPSQLNDLISQRRKMFHDIIDTIIDAGVNVLCCQKGIDEDATQRLRDAGMMALKRVSNIDMRRLSRATGAEISKNIHDIDRNKIGRAKLVMEKKIGANKYIFFEGCPYGASSIIIRGGSSSVLENIVNNIKNALNCVSHVIEDGKILPGGGATEIECALRLRKFSNTLPNREQLAVHAFSEAIMEIPRCLARNSGMDPSSVIAVLITKHANGAKNMGISAIDGEIKDAINKGIIEPLRVKKQAFISATTAAIGILRIHDLHMMRGHEKKGKRIPEFRYKGGILRY